MKCPECGGQIILSPEGSYVCSRCGRVYEKLMVPSTHRLYPPRARTRRFSHAKLGRKFFDETRGVKMREYITFKNAVNFLQKRGIILPEVSVYDVIVYYRFLLEKLPDKLKRDLMVTAIFYHLLRDKGNMDYNISQMKRLGAFTSTNTAFYATVLLKKKFGDPYTPQRITAYLISKLKINHNPALIARTTMQVYNALPPSFKSGKKPTLLITAILYTVLEKLDPHKQTILERKYKISRELAKQIRPLTEKTLATNYPVVLGAPAAYT